MFQVRIVALASVGVILLLVLGTWLPAVDACFDPASRYAVEVVLNKPGAALGLDVLEGLAADGRALRLGDSSFLLKYVFILSYLSPGDGSSGAGEVWLEFLVVMYEAKFSNGAPYVEGFNEPGEVEYYPGVRLELLSPRDVAEKVLEEKIHIIVEVFLSEALRTGLLKGLASGDVSSIAYAVRLGYAGWNDRMIYSEQLGGWAPYSRLVVTGLVQGVLLRENACSTGTLVSSDVLDAARGMESVFEAGLTLKAPPSQGDILPHLLVAIYSVVIGLAAGFATYLYMLKKTVWACCFNIIILPTDLM